MAYFYPRDASHGILSSKGSKTTLHGPPGDVACLGGSMVEHQPRLLGPGFDSRLGRL